MRALMWGVTVVVVCGAALPVRATEAAAEEWRALLESADFTSVALSSDARWVAYIRRTGSINDNAYYYSIVLRSEAAPQKERIVARSGPQRTPFAGGFVRWSPAKAEFAFRLPDGEPAIYDCNSGARRDLKLPAAAKRMFTGGISDAFEWAPDGKRIAFSAVDPQPPPGPAPSEGNVGVELSEYWDPVRAPEQARELRSFPQVTARLWVFDLRSEALMHLTDADLDVLNYSWSPDGKRIAFSADKVPNRYLGGNADLYVVDIAAQRVAPLVTQRGADDAPVWSPDGHSIAFTAQEPFTTPERPRNLRFNASLEVIDAGGGGPPRDLLASHRHESVVPLAPHNLRWSADSRFVEFEGGAELRSALYRVNRETTRLETVTPREPLLDFHGCDQQGRLRVCVREAPAISPALVMNRTARTWTVLDDGGNLGAPFAQVTSRIIQWRSADDRWDVHGIVLEPPGFDSSKRYPLVVFLEGGPSMARAQYGITTQYPLLQWAKRGYLVLAPNTRGRPGYGYDFDAAIATERSERVVPSGDVLSGIDALIKTGGADAARVGLVGFSYGFALGIETLAQSTRFKAAALGDGVLEDLTTAYTQIAQPWHPEVMRDQNGQGSLLDPETLAIAYRESTLFRLQNVKTPVLAEFGSVHTLAATQGRMLLQTLRAEHVPVELIAYPRTGHGVMEPALRMDSMRRNLEWFDYWLAGVATDRMRDRYDSTRP